MLHDYSGERLRALRRKALMTQREVHGETGVSLMTLYFVEKGIRRPQTRTLDKLLSLYAVRIQRLKNMNRLFEDKFNGGYIPGEAVVGFRSPGLDAR
jgi:transcriptional regulator with XRE-family HTH domain